MSLLLLYDFVCLCVFNFSVLFPELLLYFFRFYIFCLLRVRFFSNNNNNSNNNNYLSHSAVFISYVYSFQFVYEIRCTLCFGLYCADVPLSNYSLTSA